MAGWRRAVELTMTDEEIERLTVLSRSRTEPASQVSRGGYRKVVLHWGELGTRWGISLTVAQIHALLYSRSALSAEEIADAISVARCKVSTSLKEL